MNMNVFNTAKRLSDAYGVNSWRLAMRIKRRVCNCGRSRVDCCRTFRFWNAVEYLLDCHRYGNSTGSPDWTRHGFGAAAGAKRGDA